MSKPKIDAVEALRCARQWAIDNGYPWEPDFSIMWIDGKWHISTNTSTLGCNLDVTVCPKTGKILEHFWNAE